MTSRKAIFLDKDGTLVEDVPYNIDPEQIVFTPGVREGLQTLKQAGYLLVVVTNQSGVARGYFAETALQGVEQYLKRLLAAMNIPLAGFYYCPHHPGGIIPEYTIACPCRKPEPGLLFQAAAELDIDLNQSWFIGDILNDVEAGRKAGCRTVLIDNGNETEWQLNPDRLPHHIVADIAKAAQVILAIDRLSAALPAPIPIALPIP
jgi:D,D-heptose 1,7-bisphosphate phosphatase